MTDTSPHLKWCPHSIYKRNADVRSRAPRLVTLLVETGWHSCLTVDNVPLFNQFRSESYHRIRLGVEYVKMKPTNPQTHQPTGILVKPSR